MTDDLLLSLTRPEAEALVVALKKHLHHFYNIGPLLTAAERSEEGLLQAVLRRVNGKIIRHSVGDLVYLPEEER